MRTVAGVLEAALSELFAEPVKVIGAGRTDSGVHATGQVVSVATAARFPFDRLDLALAGLLQPDCIVREVAVVPDDFSARFSAVERTYVYAILNRRAPSALTARYAYHVPQALDLGAMARAAEPLLGEHDFRPFATVLAGQPSRRCVRRVSITGSGSLVRVEIAADGFLHRMVRRIVGMLAECGHGRGGPPEVAETLRSGDRTAAGPTAPARGLYLAGVRYPDYDSFAEPPILRAQGPRPS